MEREVVRRPRYEPPYGGWAYRRPPVAERVADRRSEVLPGQEVGELLEGPQWAVLDPQVLPVGVHHELEELRELVHVLGSGAFGAVLRVVLPILACGASLDLPAVALFASGPEGGDEVGPPGKVEASGFFL